jgi:hypothetical protein
LRSKFKFAPKAFTWENISHSNSPFHWSFIFSSLTEIVKSTIIARVMTHFSSDNCSTNLIPSIYYMLYVPCINQMYKIFYKDQQMHLDLWM